MKEQPVCRAQRTTPSETLLAEIVRRIVERAQPLRIVLFGSAARGQMGVHSDLDLLVVMPRTSW